MRHLLWVLFTVALAMPFVVKADTILPGTEIAVRTDRPIRVTEWDRGRIYQARVARDVVARDGDVAIPEGSLVELILRQRDSHEMTMDIESITVRGRRYVMDVSGPDFDTQAYNNGSGIVGAIVGAIAGVETDGPEIRIPADAVLRFELRQPLHVVDWGDPGYDRNGFHYHRDHDWYR